MTVILLIVLIPIAYLLYYGALDVLGYYVTATAGGETEAALHEAVQKRDVTICRKIIVPFGSMGPAEYDLVNGCYMGYIYETNDIALCREVISSASCVTDIAMRTNDANLCEKAYFPEYTMFQENRGECFGYFAGKEKDYGYCERLLSLSDVPESQHKICISDYIGRDKSKINLSLCDVVTNPDLKEFCIARVRNSL